MEMKCHHCGSEAIVAFAVDDDIVHMQCEKCGKEWVE
jgi:transcription elongation factor Elf1